MHDLSRVFIISPDPLERQVIREAFINISNIEVIGAAANFGIAIRQFNNNMPDVLLVSLDNESLHDDIIANSIEKIADISTIIYSKCPDRCRNISAFQEANVNYIILPRSNDRISESIITDINLIVSSIYKMSKRIRSTSELCNRIPSAHSLEKFSPPTNQINIANQWVIAIGASTGGTEAIAALLHNLPPSSPGIVLVQHMPPDFTCSFARRLNDQCHFNVIEASGGERIQPGHVIVANGATHLELAGVSGDLHVKVHNGPKVSGHRPSVDVLFQSVAQIAGSSAIGVLLTGMGEDGAKGLLKIKNSGGKTIAQDEESSVVFGMPRRAFEVGAVAELTPLSRIGKRITELYASKAVLYNPRKLT